MSTDFVLGETAVRQLMLDHQTLAGQVRALQHQLPDRNHVYHDEPFRIAIVTTEITAGTAAVFGSGEVTGLYRDRVTNTPVGTAMKSTPVFNTGPAIPVGTTIKIDKDGWGDYWVQQGEISPDSIQLENLGSGKADIPPYGCVKLNLMGRTATDDRAGGANVPIVDHLAAPYSRNGFRYIDGVVHYFTDPVEDRNANQYERLALNGSVSLNVTGDTRLGHGFLAEQSPAWGLLYDGYAPGASDIDIGLTWGPIYQGTFADVQNYDLWPGAPGFRCMGIPEEFEISTGVWRWRALFQRDRSAVEFEAVEPWTMSSNTVRCQLSRGAGNLYDGSGLFPLFETFLSSDPGAKNNAFMQLNVLTGDVIQCRAEVDSYIPLKGMTMDAAVGTVQWLILPPQGGDKRGWALANGSANSTGNGGSNENLVDEMIRGTTTGLTGNRPSAEWVATGSDHRVSGLLPYERLANGI